MILYVVATPIGNLKDITFRALEVLKEVDFVAAEDTRVSSKLLNYFDIKKPMVSYFEHNKQKKGSEIVNRIINGEKCAIITDAGTPAISDPGEDLVSLCIENGIKVIPIPGASAVISALSVSGQPTGRFTFEGFLSTNKRNRNEHLEQIKNDTRTLVFYEAPHKLKKTLADMFNTFGNRNITICREITKKFEEYVKTDLKSAINLYNETEPKGEFVLIIEGAKKEIYEVSEELIDLGINDVIKLIKSGEKLKDAVKKVSESRKIPKNNLYNLALIKIKDEEQ